MKRISIAAVCAGLVLMGLAFIKPASADPVVGSPNSYAYAHALDAVGQSATVDSIPANVYACTVAVYGTFVGTVDVYTSVDGTFDDAVKQKKFTAPGTITVAQTATPWTAIRAQNRAFTSGDPIAAIDCGNAGYAGQIVVEPVAEPTPTATP